MATIAEEAKQHESGTMIGNIADLDKVSVAIDVSEKEYTRSDNEKFKIKTINVDGMNYRVPNSVLENLKVLLEERPQLKFFKVRKDGTGMNTRYTVIPIE